MSEPAKIEPPKIEPGAGPAKRANYHDSNLGMDNIDRIVAMAGGMASTAHRVFDLFVMHSFPTVEEEVKALEHARAMLLTAFLETARVVEALQEKK